MKKHTYNIIVLAMFVILMTSCGIYSFTGTSIQPDVKTVNIEYFEYKALKVNPTLANRWTVTRISRLPARLRATT